MLPLNTQRLLRNLCDAKAEDVVEKPKRIVESYLVDCARLGDRAAQEQLVVRYQKKFLRHAYRLLGDAEQAKEAVQDGWMEIVRGLPKLKDHGAFQAWAFRIVTRRCAKYIAGLQRTRAMIETVACEPAALTPGKPKAHRSRSRGTSSAVMPTEIRSRSSSWPAQKSFPNCTILRIWSRG